MAFLLLRKTRTKATIVSKPTTPAILTVFELTAPLNESIYSQAIISATPVKSNSVHEILYAAYRIELVGRTVGIQL